MTNLTKVKVIEGILNRQIRAYTLDNLLVELTKQGKNDFDENSLPFEEAIEKLIKDGKIGICFPYDKNGNKQEIGIISKKEKLWRESYESMRNQRAALSDGSFTFYIFISISTPAMPNKPMTYYLYKLLCVSISINNTLSLLIISYTTLKFPVTLMLRFPTYFPVNA